MYIKHATSYLCGGYLHFSYTNTQKKKDINSSSSHSMLLEECVVCVSAGVFVHKKIYVLSKQQIAIHTRDKILNQLHLALILKAYIHTYLHM